MKRPVLVAVEGDTDGPVAAQLLRAAGLDVDRLIVMHGHGTLDKRVGRWCSPSNHRPMLVLRDLDPMLGALCVPSLVARLTGSHPTTPTTVVRIAVRELEAWLLADHKNFARFFSVSEASVPLHPDGEADPKARLVQLCRSSSSSRIRRGMVPTARSGRAVGPEFTGLLLEYTSSAWNIEHAVERSPSLARALEAVRALALSLE